MITKDRLDINRSKKVIAALGGKTILAKKFGVSRQAVDQWARYGIPSYRMQTIRLMFRSMPEVKETRDFHPWSS